MSDCCISPPSVGTWKIYVRTPIYFPNRVKYNWNDGNGFHTIEGNSYLITEVIPENTICDITIRKYQTYFYEGNQIPFNVTIETWRSKCPAYLRKDLQSNGWTYVYLIGGTTNIDIQILGVFNTVAYGMGVDILNEQPVNNTNKNYKLQIFKDNELIYSETKTTQPTAELIPEYCLQADQRTYVRDYQNNKQNDYCQQVIQGNQTTFILMSEQTNNTFLPTVLAYSSSPEQCSLAPIYEVDCISCKNCPENTCEIICGDMVCCYNSQGIAVDSFPIGELCV